MSFSKNLLKLRKSKGLSQEELGHELGLSRQAISKWELEISKPDIDNVVKISKFFDVAVDDLIGNEFIKTEAVPINIKEDTKKKKFLKITRGVIVCSIILFIIIVIYKFIMLFRITKVGARYKELDNYHYVIFTYLDLQLIEKEEHWFKDGISKTIETIYGDDSENIIMTCIDYNKYEGYITNSTDNKKVNLDVNEYLQYNKGYEKGGRLYYKFPEIIKETNIINMINECLNSNDFSIKQYDSNVFLNFKTNYVKLENNTLLPMFNYYRNEATDKFKYKQYEIELNSVDSIKI